MDDSISADFSSSHSYGSYLVFRKLEQAVVSVDSQLLRNPTANRPDLVGAYAVERFQDGTPLISFGSSPGTTTNNFDFTADRTGSKCPIHSHIRKSNPICESPGGVDFDRRVRITRRGIPYVEPGSEDNKGLLFINQTLKIRSTFIQYQWVDNRNF